MWTLQTSSGWSLFSHLLIVLAQVTNRTSPKYHHWYDYTKVCQEFDNRAEKIELRSKPYMIQPPGTVSKQYLKQRYHLLHNGNLLPEAVRL